MIYIYIFFYLHVVDMGFVLIMSFFLSQLELFMLVQTSPLDTVFGPKNRYCNAFDGSGVTILPADDSFNIPMTHFPQSVDSHDSMVHRLTEMTMKDLSHSPNPHTLWPFGNV